MCVIEKEKINDSFFKLFNMVLTQYSPTATDYVYTTITNEHCVIS